MWRKNPIPHQPNRVFENEDMMEYAIEILKERLEKLEHNYYRFVVIGEVCEFSAVAIDNRRKVKELNIAIMKLNETT